MKKILLIALVSVSFTACSGGKNNKKIKDLVGMDIDQLAQVTESLTPKESEVVGVAVAECRADPKAEVCKKSVKQVIK